VRNPRGYVVRGVFEDAYNYMKSGHLLRQVINKLNAIDFNRQSERHQFNDLYEKILKDLQSAGNAGEFYTPRAVTQFMVDMVNPQLGETVLDPATGTGGFLVCAIEHLRKQVHNHRRRSRAAASIRGVEKKQLPHMLCVTNLLLHGIEVPSNIRHDNTLARPLREYTQADRVDVVLTNPPFGGIEEPGIEQGFPADVRTKETADLFLVLIKHILKSTAAPRWCCPTAPCLAKASRPASRNSCWPSATCTPSCACPTACSPLHRHQDQPAVLHQGQPTQHVWYYEHPYPRA
jgi:type I restriction enzyme M protein